MPTRIIKESMVTLLHWQNIIVPQRHITGCVPTGYEWLIRYLDIEGINLDTFQEDFDLQRSGECMNSFGAVAKKVGQVYSHIKMIIREFDNGNDKIEFMKELLKNDIPCLMSLASSQSGETWHIVPVVSIGDTKIKVVWTGSQTSEFTITDVIDRHNNWQGGKDISWIES